MAKVDGVKNRKYGRKVLKFYLALSVSGDKKAFEYVSGNLVDVSLHHIQLIMTRLCTSHFISLNEEEMMPCVHSLFARIRVPAGDPNLHLSFSIGIDATALVESFQISSSNQAIVGGASTHQYISIEEMTSQEFKNKLQDCLEGNNGEMAAS